VRTFKAVVSQKPITSDARCCNLRRSHQEGAETPLYRLVFDHILGFLQKIAQRTELLATFDFAESRYT
jgi:hypothetical protein